MRSDTRAHLHRCTKLGHATLEVLLDGRPTDVQEISHLTLCPSVSTHQNDSDTLVTRQALYRAEQPGLHPGIDTTVWHRGNGRAPKAKTSDPALSDSVQIADRVLHFPQAFPVLPCVSDRLCGCLGAQIRAIGGSEGIRKTPLGITNERIEFLILLFAPRSHALPGLPSPHQTITPWGMTTGNRGGRVQSRF